MKKIWIVAVMVMMVSQFSFAEKTDKEAVATKGIQVIREVR